MTLEKFAIKHELRKLIDAYASLGDAKKIAEQMQLFTSDATYKVYMNGVVVATTSGTEILEKEFNSHAAQVKTYFTLNGQHTTEIAETSATGESYSQLKMVREVDGNDIITDYSVKYVDSYVKTDGKWLIKDRIGYFLIIEARQLVS